MENNVQVQKIADISSLVGVVIVSLSALTAYNLGEKFNHYILFDVTIFIISLVMLILTFGSVSLSVSEASSLKPVDLR